jgi:arylsulfatase A-like enzyme
MMRPFACTPPTGTARQVKRGTSARPATRRGNPPPDLPSYLPAAVLLLACAVVLAPSAPLHAQDASQRPNVLFISIDDLNDWLGAMGTHPQVRTPNIDRLAERGTLFLNAHTPAPLCNPARVAIMTGLRPTTTGIYGLAPGNRQVPATANEVTLGQYFAAHGYQTMSGGKIFHGGHSEDEFQAWGPPGTFTRLADKIVQPVVHMGNHPLMDWGILPEGADTTRSDYRVSSWAVNHLDRIGRGTNEAPFFMAVGLVTPHVPFYAEQKWFDMYPEAELVLPPAPPGDRDDVPEFAWYLNWYLPEPRLSWLIENDQWRPKVRAFLAAVSYMDAQVGRVLDALDRNGLADKTIVVFWSDHGYHLGEKDLTGKNTLWERSTRVPLIYAGPGITAGARTARPTDLMDLYPTLAELAGLPRKEGLDGISVVPQLRDPAAPRERPALTTANPGNHGIRSERWRYIRYANGSQELYDHSRDPHEWSNLAGRPEYASVIADLARWIPREEAPHAPGSANRVLWREGETWYWEGKPIVPEELID